MSKNYSEETIDKFLKDNTPSIFILKDNTVHIGVLKPGYGRGRVMCTALNINEDWIGFRRSYIKKIVSFNGLVYPKTQKEKYKILDIIELNELVNKAGYEFI